MHVVLFTVSRKCNQTGCPSTYPWLAHPKKQKALKKELS